MIWSVFQIAEPLPDDRTNVLLLAILFGVVLLYAVVTASLSLYARRDLQRRGQPQKAVTCAVAFTASLPLGLALWLFWRHRYPVREPN